MTDEEKKVEPDTVTEKEPEKKDNRTDEEIITEMSFEKIAQVKIYQLHLIAELINLSMKRGTFSAGEASHVGAIFDTIAGAIAKSREIAEKEFNANKSN